MKEALAEVYPGLGSDDELDYIGETFVPTGDPMNAPNNFIRVPRWAKKAILILQDGATETGLEAGWYGYLQMAKGIIGFGGPYGWYRLQNCFTYDLEAETDFDGATAGCMIRVLDDPQMWEYLSPYCDSPGDACELYGKVIFIP